MTKAPLRISLGGGGTDLPFYSSRFSGNLIFGAINKYIYTTVQKRLEHNYKLSCDSTDYVDKIGNIKHDLIREALKYTSIDDKLEIHSSCNVPSGTGLGSSHSFLVGLLHALYVYKGERVTKYMLAEAASEITMDLLKEPCGKQDQYAAAFGGISNLTISKAGKTLVTHLNLTPQQLTDLESRLMLFYAGFTRSSKSVLTEQERKASLDEEIYSYYHAIKAIGKESKTCLIAGNFERFGKLLDKHWHLKKNISSKMTNSSIDELYELAKEGGALGGKIIGAGGGGFLMIYAGQKDIRELITTSFIERGLVRVSYNFDLEGSSIIYISNK